MVNPRTRKAHTMSGDPPATEPRMDVKLYGSWQPAGPAMIEALEDYQPNHPLLAALREHPDHQTAAYYTAFGYRKAHCNTCSRDIWNHAEPTVLDTEDQKVR